MIQFDKFLKSAPRLSKPRIRTVYSYLGNSEADSNDSITLGTAVLLWLAQDLDMCGYIDRDQIDLILRHFGQVVRAYGNEIDTSNAVVKPKVCHLMIADRRYCALSGVDGFLNLASGDVIKEMPRAPAEVISYNLYELIMRSTERMKRIEEVNTIDDKCPTNTLSHLAQ